MEREKVSIFVALCILSHVLFPVKTSGADSCLW